MLLFHGLPIKVPGEVVEGVLVTLATLTFVPTPVESLALQWDTLKAHRRWQNITMGQCGLCTE
jgi:hypothetical protein